MSLPAEKRTVYDDGNVVADYIQSCRPSERDRVLFVTFDPMFVNDVEGDGFGGKYLLSIGADLVAFKKRNDGWYQSVSRPEFRSVVSRISQNYDDVVLYGSSMGAYAALYFSSEIRCRVLAISPCCYIHPDFPSHLVMNKGRDKVFFHERFSDELGRRNVSGVVYYDPQNRFDFEFVDKLVKISFPSLSYVPVHFGGHSSIEFMSEVGELKSVVSRFLAREAPTFAVAGKKNRSKKFLYTFARKLESVGRFRQAASVVELAISLSPQAFAFLDLRARLAQRSLQHEEALDWLLKALNLRPKDADLHKRMAETNLSLGRLDEAVLWTDKALFLKSDDAALHKLRSVILDKMGLRDEAGDAAICAALYRPDDAYLHFHCSSLLLRNGRLGAAEAFIRRAVSLDPAAARYREMAASIRKKTS